MAIKARFPSGVNTIKIDALYQWDYGRELEIESEDLLASIVEVHFSCSGMTEAVVRSCSVLNGVATVTIPDSCLEQDLNITAWVYEIEGTQGKTTKSITIPVIKRARPNRPAEIPQTISDVYTELVTEINEAVESLKTGDVVAKEATHANTAGTAETANTATHANTADAVNTANIAVTANTANVAMVAEYSSADKTQGTIEERLSKLRSDVTNVTNAKKYLHQIVINSPGVSASFSVLSTKSFSSAVTTVAAVAALTGTARLPASGYVNSTPICGIKAAGNMTSLVGIYINNEAVVLSFDNPVITDVVTMLY